jgi:hypothetical protein
LAVAAGLVQVAKEELAGLDRDRGRVGRSLAGAVDDLAPITSPAPLKATPMASRKPKCCRGSAGTYTSWRYPWPPGQLGMRAWAVSISRSSARSGCSSRSVGQSRLGALLSSNDFGSSVERDDGDHPVHGDEWQALLWR